MVPISPGELIDKITILEIRVGRMTDADQARERAHRTRAADRDTGTRRRTRPTSPTTGARCAASTSALVIGDRIRDKERASAFDAVFIELARAVYVTNDERAAIKKRINTRLGSRLVEEKSYASTGLGA